MIAYILATAAASDPEIVETEETEETAETEPVGPDRSAPPEVVPPEPLELPEPDVHDLGNGVVAWHLRVPSVRKVAVHIVVQRGLVDLVGGPHQDGRAAGWLADAAAGPHDPTDLSLLRDIHDIELWSSVGLHDGRVALVAPKEELELGLQLQRLVLTEATFPKRDVKRFSREQHLFYGVQGPSSQGTLANSVVGFGWFPSDHPYGMRPDLAELDGLRTAHLAALWDRLLTEGPVTAVVVGDIAWADVEAPLKAVVAGLGAEVERSPALEVPLGEGTRVVAVDMPGQEQAALRLRLNAAPEGHADRVATSAANWVLGGHFLSRLNQILREDKGFTYGAGSRYHSGPEWGAITVSVDVASENLAETISIVEDQVAGLVEGGVDAAELETARRSRVQDWNLTFLNAERAASLVLEALDEDVSLADMRARHLAMADLTSDDVQRVAEAWLGPDDPRLWVVVGDRSALESQLVEAGLEATWVDPRDAILGKF